jgi:hypothetical protein
MAKMDVHIKYPAGIYPTTYDSSIFVGSSSIYSSRTTSVVFPSGYRDVRRKTTRKIPRKLVLG